MNQHGPTWGQLEKKMDLKINGKPLFFLGFFNVFRKSLEAFGNVLVNPLGTPWGTFGDAWGILGDAMGSLGDPLGDLGDA